MTRHLAILYSAKRYTYRSGLVRWPCNNIPRLGLPCEVTMAATLCTRRPTWYPTSPLKTYLRIGLLEEPNRVHVWSRSQPFRPWGRTERGEPREGVCPDIPALRRTCHSATRIPGTVCNNARATRPPCPGSF